MHSFPGGGNTCFQVCPRECVQGTQWQAEDQVPGVPAHMQGTQRWEGDQVLGFLPMCRGPSGGQGTGSWGSLLCSGHPGHGRTRATSLNMKHAMCFASASEAGRPWGRARQEGVLGASSPSAL